MDSLELTRWAAFEQEYGPLLVHDRIDMGFGHLMFLLAQVYHAPRTPKPQFKDFVPPYIRKRLEEGTRQSAEQLKAVMDSMVNDATP
jgi:hypothetical protein